MKAPFTLFLLLFFLTQDLPAQTQKELQCEVNIQLASGFNPDPKLPNDFHFSFGGTNTIVAGEKFNAGYRGRILNKTGGLDLEILITWNYWLQQLEFVGGSLVGNVYGQLTQCSSYLIF